MFKADKGFFMDGEEQYLSYTPYKILTSRWDNKKFERIDITRPEEASALTMMQQIGNVADLDAGTNRYTLGGGGIERSATGATYQQAITRDKLNPLIESINNDLLTKAAEYFSFLGIKYLPYQFKVRITGTDNIHRFETITHESLKWRFDIYFNVETFKNTTKELEKSQNIQALQIIWQAWVDPVGQRYLLNQEKILAKTIDVFEYPIDSILSKDDFYQRQADEELAKLRAQKYVRDTAAKEWLIPEQWQWGIPPQWGMPPQWWGGEPQQIPGIATDPEDFEDNLEAENTQKIDMWEILARAAQWQ